MGDSRIMKQTGDDHQKMILLSPILLSQNFSEVLAR
jgi:hypothetical protein